MTNLKTICRFSPHRKPIFFVLLLVSHFTFGAVDTTTWKVGIAKARITPTNLFWMGGFASRSKPAEGTLDDLKVKALALEAKDSARCVLIPLDLVGIPRWLYDDLCTELDTKYGLKRNQLRFAA
jgi:neutral ceramidase